MFEKMDAISAQLTALSGAPPADPAVKTEDPTQKILNAIKEQTEILKRDLQKGEGADDDDY
jgi:hypothetical protein